MITEIVEVLEAKNNQIKIKLNRRPTCSCCRLNSICGKNEEILTIERQDFLLNKGDRIEIGIEEKKTVFACVVTFLIPAIIFIAALLVFSKKISEVKSFIGALVLLAAYYGAVKFFVRGKLNSLDLKILKKVSE